MTKEEKDYFEKLIKGQTTHFEGVAKKQAEHFESVVKEQAEESRRHMKVLIEHTDSQVAAVAEQYTEIKATLDLHTEILMANQETLVEHDKAIKELQKIR